MHTFINVYMHRISHGTTYLKFAEEKKDKILNNYKVVGDGCYLVGCRFIDDTQLNAFLEKLNEIANYKISIVLTRKA